MINPGELADKFFKGLCSENEAKAFLAWYFSENAEKALKKEIEERWLDNETYDEWNEASVFERIQQAKQENKLFVSHKAEAEVKKQRIKSIRKKKAIKYRWYTAACLAVLICSLLIVRYWPAPYSGAVKARAPEFIIKSNPAGQKSTIYLGDGSQVVLNSASTIRYPLRFATQERLIYLEGEAFFKVAKDSLRPFSVMVDSGTQVTALGTSFNIRSFKGEKKTSIALLSGKVEVKGRDDSGKQQLVLEPGEGVEYRKSGGSFTKIQIDPDQTIAWKHGILYFNKAPVGQVIKELERWYDVQIQIPASIAGNFTGRFQNQTLKAVLEGLAYSFSLTYTIDGKSVEIKQKNHQ